MKKKYLLKANIHNYGFIFKLFRVMRISAFLLFIGILQVFANDSYSQTTRLTLSMSDATVQQVLEEIESQSEFFILFNHQLVDVNRKVNIEVSNKKINNILTALFKTTDVEYFVMGRQIILSPKSILYEGVAGIQQIQGKVVTGTVTDENGEPLPGLSIVIKGTTAGTVTNLDGKYTIEVEDPSAVLVFSFIGYMTQEVAVGEQTEITITMVQDLIGIDEVVITALGIEKSKKAVGYSVTNVSGEDFVEAREINIMNALAGKVAGVNISSMATGPSSSSHVIIRGNTSLSAANQPLYVIDGIPIDNTQMGTSGKWGGNDWGDGISSISPDNIESITVLKGNSAAALYGSRASNGVILITSKKGRKRKGLGVEFSTNYVTDHVINYSNYQKEYGHGYYGEKPVSEAEALNYGLYSYGAKLDGSDVVQFDGVSRPYSDVGDNVKRFYNTGSTWTNTLALSGGNDTHTFRFAVSNLDNKGIVPDATMNRKNFSLNVNGQYGKRLTASAKIDYMIEDVHNRSRLNDSPGNVNYTVFSLPPSIDVETLKGTTDKLGAAEDGTELKFNSNRYVNNPYWTAYQFLYNTGKNRVIGSMLLKYDFTDWLYLQGRIGTDWYSSSRCDLTPYGTAYRPTGQLYERKYEISEYNADVMLGWDHSFGDIGFSGFVGGNYMRHDWEYMRIGGSTFNIPFFHDVSNIATQGYSSSVQKHGTNSLFGSAEVSFKDYLFMNVTARQDWFSTLDGAGVLYPSVSLSWLFSETIDMPEWVSFGKARASWAQVGGGVDKPYQTLLTYRLYNGHVGEPSAWITQTSIPNTDLKPFTSSEYEFGFDIRILKNRLGVDFTYYDRKTENDILSSSVSLASGYLGATVNVGEVTNSGVELLINAGIVRNQDFTWDATLIFAHNTNEVISLAEGIDNMLINSGGQSRTLSATIHNVVGLPYSQIYGYKYRTNDQGVRMYDAAGLPLRSTELHPLGSGISPTTMGLNNSFTYKDFNLTFLIDMKTGGKIYVASDAYGYVRGFHQNTLEGRESGLDVSGVDEEGAAFSYHIDAADIQTYYQRVWGITEEFIEDASFIKLRQFTLGYNLPYKLVNNTPFSSVNVSLVGRNLLLLWSKTTNIDPESTYLPSNAQGLEGFGVPPTRSFGVNVSVKF